MIALLMPFTQMFLLGYGVTLDLKHIPICTFDREASQNSQALLKHFEASSYFTISRNVRAYPDLVNAIDRSDCKLAIVIPPDFSERLNDTGQSTVQAILDATDDNTANIALAMRPRSSPAIPAMSRSTRSTARALRCSRSSP